MTYRLNSHLTLVVACWIVGLSPAAWALKPDNITATEMAMLPRYCPDSQTFKELNQVQYSPETRKWVDAMGVGFFHVHHYCWARINYQRAQRMTKYLRDFKLQEVHGDLLYVINNASPDFILLPEVYTWLGRTDTQLDLSREADQAFEKARSLKPDYWPAYFHWAEWLRSKGKRAEALQMVGTGLQYAPSSRPLLLLYKDLGGKPADIPPPIPKAQEEDAEPPPAAQPDSPLAPPLGPKNPLP